MCGESCELYPQFVAFDTPSIVLFVFGTCELSATPDLILQVPEPTNKPKKQTTRKPHPFEETPPSVRSPHTEWRRAAAAMHFFWGGRVFVKLRGSTGGRARRYDGSELERHGLTQTPEAVTNASCTNWGQRHIATFKKTPQSYPTCSFTLTKDGGVIEINFRESQFGGTVQPAGTTQRHTTTDLNLKVTAPPRLRRLSQARSHLF